MSSIMTNASALTALQSLNCHQQEPRNDAVPHFDGLPRRHRHRQRRLLVDRHHDAFGQELAFGRAGRARPRRRQGRHRLPGDHQGDRPRSTKSRTSWSPPVGASDVDKAKIQTEITALQAQMKMGADGATYSGSNMLSLNTTDRHRLAGVADDAKIVSAFTRNAAGTVALQTIDINVDSVKMYEAFATATGSPEGHHRRPAPGHDRRARRSPRRRRSAAHASAATDGYRCLDADRGRLSTTARSSEMLNVVDTATKELTTARPSSAPPRRASTSRRCSRSP